MTGINLIVKYKKIWVCQLRMVCLSGFQSQDRGRLKSSMQAWASNEKWTHCFYYNESVTMKKLSVGLRGVRWMWKVISLNVSGHIISPNTWACSPYPHSLLILSPPQIPPFIYFFFSNFLIPLRHSPWLPGVLNCPLMGREVLDVYTC